VQDPSSQVVPGLRYEGMLEIWSINGGLRYQSSCFSPKLSSTKHSRQHMKKHYPLT